MLFSKQKINLALVFLFGGGFLLSRDSKAILNKRKSPYPAQGKIVQAASPLQSGSNASFLQGEPNADPASEWLFLIYVAARNNLAPYAAENLKEISENLKSDKVHALVQWDQVDQKGAWRYYLKNGKIDLVDYSNVQNPRDAAQKMIDFVSYGIAKYPSKKVCVVFWNHGSGAIESMYGDPLRYMVDNTDLLGNPAIDFNEMWNFANAQTQLLMGRGDDRAICFDEVNKTCINNKQLKHVFEEIHTKLGHKIDVLGFDACYQAMTEIAHTAKDHALYMVGSEELELAKGWDYAYIMRAVSNKPTISAKELSCEIVKGFELCYKQKTPYYTQSAIDLSKIDQICSALDGVVLGLQDNFSNFGHSLINAILKARKSCLQFSVKVYVDSCSMLRWLGAKILEENLGHDVSAFKNVNNFLGYDDAFLKSKKVDERIIDLLARLRLAHATIESSVIKNVASNQFRESCGLSIYFPTNKFLDPSYVNNNFCEKSLWRRFLLKICEAMN